MQNVSVFVILILSLNTSAVFATESLDAKESIAADNFDIKSVPGDVKSMTSEEVEKIEQMAREAFTSAKEPKTAGCNAWISIELYNIYGQQIYSWSCAFRAHIYALTLGYGD